MTKTRRGKWAQRFRALEQVTGFRDAERDWGGLSKDLLAVVAGPDGEREIKPVARTGNWGKLCRRELDMRHGRWSIVVKELGPEIYQRMNQRLPAGAGAAWAGRAANLLAEAAMRMNDENTAKECFDWVARLCENQKGSEAIEAQMLRLRGWFHLRRRYQDLDLAQQDLLAAQQSFRGFPHSSPWRQIGLSRLLDTLGEYYADIGDAQSAQDAFRESIQAKELLGDTYGQAISHGKLGRLFLEMYEPRNAERELTADLDLTKSMRDRRGETIALNNLAEVCLVEAEGYTQSTGEKFEVALEYLEEALHISREIGNRVGEGLALVGLARRLLTPQHVEQNDIGRAVDFAEEGYELLMSNSRRPEWKRYAQLWTGWGHAKLAETEQRLREVEDQYFVPAIEDLREAGLSMDLAEAIFQRARMLSTEGKRLGMAQQDRIVECLCEAIEQANMIRAKSLARRYLAMAKGIDAELWVGTLTRHRETLADLTSTSRRLRTMVEDRLNALHLISHEIKQPLLELSLRFADVSESRDMEDSPWKTVSAAVERLRGIERTLDLLKLPMDFQGRQDTAELKDVLDDCPVFEVARRACLCVKNVFSEDGVQLINEIDENLVWPTVPDILENILYNLLHNAAKYAKVEESPDNRKVMIRCNMVAGPQLQIDVLNTGEPLDIRRSDWVFRRGTTTTPEDTQTRARHGYGLYLARYFARRLRGDIAVRQHPPQGWSTQFRAYFEPLNPPHRNSDDIRNRNRKETP